MFGCNVIREQYRLQIHELSSYLIEYFKVNEIKDCQKITFVKMKEIGDVLAIEIRITRSSDVIIFKAKPCDISWLIDQTIMRSTDETLIRRLRAKKLAIELEL